MLRFGKIERTLGAISWCVRYTVSGMRFSPRPNRAGEINWQEWGEPAFQKAQAEGKRVLLSISAVWCHWCHVLDETTLSDSEVIALVNRPFVAVRVDNDQRPDINSRYNMGGWPTTAFLTGDGDVITGATYMAVQEFKDALIQVSEAYSQRKDLLSQRAYGLRSKRQEKASLVSAAATADATIVDAITRAVVAAHDPDHGGFGSEPKFPMCAAVELLLHSYQLTGDAAYRLMVEKTLDKMVSGGLFDREEGGFFRYSTKKDWSAPHSEEMLEDNAALLGPYLRGSLVIDNGKYAGLASSIVDYLNGHLYDATSGAFCGSQGADEAYYALTLAQRKEQGPPVIDSILYTGPNAAVASAYLDAAWLLNRPALRDMALGTLDFPLGRCQGEPLRHSYSGIDGVGVPALLTDYAFLVKALVDAHSQTFHQRFLEEAERLAGAMIDIFWDARRGGFFDIPEDPQAVDNLRVRDKPIGDNVSAIEALTRLLYSTLTQRYRDIVESTLDALVPVYSAYGEMAAGYGLAHRFLYPPIEVTVVGKPGNPETRSLVHAVATIPYPHTAIRYIDAEDGDRLAQVGYWAGQEALAYVCLETVCLAPIGDPDELQRAARSSSWRRLPAEFGGIIRDIGSVG